MSKTFWPRNFDHDILTTTFWSRHFDHDILTTTIWPRHIVHDILSMTFCPITFCPHNILSATFCPWHFVRWHFVLQPPRAYRLYFLLLSCFVFHFIYFYNTSCVILYHYTLTENFHVFHMWFTCKIPHFMNSKPVFSHVIFDIRNFTWEISHVTIHIWNSACEISHVIFLHVKFYMWNLTCDFSREKFYMWLMPSCHMKLYLCN